MSRYVMKIELDDIPSHPSLGRPTAFYPYEYPDGSASGICRFEAEDKKNIRPVLYNEEKSRWEYKGGPKPYPLFNQRQILENPDKAILFHEGEKSASKGKELLPDYVSTTTIYGAQSPRSSDFSAVKGRNVTIFPDHDDAGYQYAQKVAELCLQSKASQVSVVELPRNFPAQWDIADELPEGVTIDKIKELIDNAPSYSPSNAMPKGYSLGRKCLQYQKLSNDKKGQVINVSSPISVLGYLRDGSSQEWAKLVRFQDPDGYTHELSIPMKMLGGEGGPLRELLLSHGLVIYPGLEASRLLVQFLILSEPKARFTSVHNTGWQEVGDKSAFVFPSASLGDDSIVYQKVVGFQDPYSSKGSLQDWVRNVGRYCSGNSRLILAVSAALSGPVLKLLEGESGGYNLYGPSSIGKSTALHVGGSVWGGGGPNGFKRPWRATINGIEGIAKTHCDTLLALDELNQAKPDSVAGIIYLIGNGQGKTRANRNGLPKKESEWRIICLSTGERTISEIVEGTGESKTIGQLVRMVDIDADAGKDLGLFEYLHNEKDPAEFAEKLEENSKSQFYGALGPAFVELLISMGDSAVTELRDMEKSFLERCELGDATGQVKRVARRFALTAAAGELATKMTLVPWHEGEAFLACKSCFDDWLSTTSKSVLLEEKQAFESVKSYLENYGDSMFVNPDSENGDIRSLKKAGFVKSIGEEEYFCVFPKFFRDTVCKGPSYKQTIDALVRGTLILKGENGRPDKKVRVLDTNQRFICISKKIFECDGIDGNWEQNLDSDGEVLDITRNPVVPRTPDRMSFKDTISS